MDILEKWRAVLRRNGRRRASFSDALKHLEGMAATRRI